MICRVIIAGVILTCRGGLDMLFSHFWGDLGMLRVHCWGDLDMPLVHVWGRSSLLGVVLTCRLFTFGLYLDMSFVHF